MQTPPKQNGIMPLITELLHFFCLKTIKKFLREDTITAEPKKGERGWLIKSVGLGLQVCNDRGVRCVEVKEIREVPMERPCVPPSAGLTPREPPSRRSLSRLIKHLLCCYTTATGTAAGFTGCPGVDLWPLLPPHKSRRFIYVRLHLCNCLWKLWQMNYSM